MTETIEDLKARAESAEAALLAIRGAIGDWMPPDSDLDNRDLIVVITELLEAYGLQFVADDAFECLPRAPELPLGDRQRLA